MADKLYNEKSTEIFSLSKRKNLDYKEKNCQEVVDVIDVNTKRMLASYLLNNFEEGVYLSFGVSGNVQFRITRFFYDHYGNPDYPVCSAIFFDKE